MIHVGGTRCVPFSTDNMMKIHARITLTVEFIRTCWWYSLCTFQSRQHDENTGSDHVDCWSYTNLSFCMFLVCVNTMTSRISTNLFFRFYFFSGTWNPDCRWCCDDPSTEKWKTKTCSSGWNTTVTWRANTPRSTCLTATPPPSGGRGLILTEKKKCRWNRFWNDSG